MTPVSLFRLATLVTWVPLGWACATQSEAPTPGDEVDAPTSDPAPGDGSSPGTASRSLATSAADLEYVSAFPTPPKTFTLLSGAPPNICAIEKGGALWCRSHRGWSDAGWNAGADLSKFLSVGDTHCVLSDGRIRCSGRSPFPDEQNIRDFAISRGGIYAVSKKGEILRETSAGAAPLPSGPFVAIACDSECCATKEDGGVTCWGERSVAAPKLELSHVRVGANGNCGLDPAGNAHCWGQYSPHGHEGPFNSLHVGRASACGVRADGHSDCWNLATAEPFALPPVHPTGLAIGGDASCVLDAQGGLTCSDKLSFGPIPTGAFDKLSGGLGTVCGLRRDGEVLCWGWDSAKQVGIPQGRHRDLSAAMAHACAVGHRGELRCWGSGFGGGLDTPPGLFASVVAGSLPCALDGNGKATCWGANNNGQLGGQYLSLAAGSAYTCGLGTDGTIDCAEGDDFLAGRTDATPPGDARFERVFSGYEHMCGLDKSGRATCWGRDVGGETVPPADIRFATLALGEKRSCGVTKKLAIHCWGGSPSAPHRGPFIDVAMTENTALDEPAYVCGILEETATVKCWEYGRG